jgi:hypothetical protein
LFFGNFPNVWSYGNKVHTQLREQGDPLAPHSLSASELKAMMDAERAGRHFFACRDESGLIQLLAAPGPDEVMTLGRYGDAGISLSWDREVSGLHAELQGFGEECTIVDDGLSTNGTFVNGKRIRGRYRLRDGDRVRAGRTILAYKAGGSTAVFETLAAVDGPEMFELSDTQRRVLVALCRPFRDGSSFATAATNQQIANEVFLSVDGVKTHLRSLFGKFELTGLPQNQKRARLAESALRLGVVTQRDFA